MFEPLKIEYRCPRCHTKVDSPGECFICRTKSPYQKGYEDGQSSVRPKYLDLPLYEPPQIDLRTPYEKGFDEGRRSAVGCSGLGSFDCTGE